MNQPNFKYASQSHAPSWFDPAEPLHVSATSGSSPFNEWYAFNSYEDAYHVIAGFSSQSFIDDFVQVDDEQEFYHHDDVTSEEVFKRGFPVDGYVTTHKPKEGASPACLQSLIDAESRF